MKFPPIHRFVANVGKGLVRVKCSDRPMALDRKRYSVTGPLTCLFCKKAEAEEARQVG